MTGIDMDRVLQRIDGDFPASLARLFELLRFPSVGTDPAHDADCRKAAEWLKQNLDGMGFRADIHKTTGQPVVLATYDPPKAFAAARRHVPHVLFYGHYDVQPADPLNLWTTPPFEPEVRPGKDGRPCIYARGASDDKGQVMTFVEASRAWLTVMGHLPFRLTVLIEGDEEGDAEHLDRFIAANKDKLKADVALVCDTGLWDPKTPAIVSSLRGCIAEEVTITGPRIDLHSGYYGGPAVNPIKVLSRMLGDMHDARGHIAIPGFYDGIKVPKPAVRKAWKSIPFSAKEFLGGVGLKTSAGEKDFTLLEQLWVRPTAEVNGIQSGYTGAGSKTVLPAKASAKLTFRLVQGQNPKNIRKAFRRYVKSKLPPDCKVAFSAQGGDNAGVAIADDNHWVLKAATALESEWGKAPVIVGAGGSIPVVESFARHLGLNAVLMGFCNKDDALHSPNEKYNVESYHKGMHAWARFFGEIAKDMT